MHTLAVLGLLSVELGILVWFSIHMLSSIVSVLHGAPYVPMERYRVQALLSLAGLKSGDIFYDLGSGDGRIAMAAIRDFHVAQSTGYEVSPWPYWKSRWRIYRSGLRVSINNQNLFAGNFTDATCVYAYLFPKLMDRVAEKLGRDLKPGARVICPAFAIDTEKHPEFELKKEEKIGTLIAYLYEKA